jgi:hypothetical protein
MVERRGLRRDSIQRVAFPQRQIDRSVSIDRHRPRTVERRAFQGRAIRRWQAFAGSADGLDRAGREIHRADAMVSDIADQQPAVRSDSDAVRLAQLRFRRRAAVT